MTYRFFLGGRDLEMREIGKLLSRHAPNQLEDKGLAWGARFSDYHEELIAALRRGETPVIVELFDDLPLDVLDRSRIVIVDHHGDDAGHGRPTSIEQVFRLLNLPQREWTRWLALVAANDRAHVAGLRELGADPEEIAEVRAADRAAQGLTPADEAEARRALAARRQEGRLTVVETTGSTSSAIADLILPDLGGPGYDRLLVTMPEEVAVFGDGDAIAALAKRYPGSYWGGDLPRAGFWGMSLRSPRSGSLNSLIEQLR
jgi:hypothetical protein